MRVPFDQSRPFALRSRAPRSFHGVRIRWSNLENGDLPREAEGRFEVFVTTDQNLRFQQNLGGRRLAILVLPTTNWPEIQRHQSEVAGAVNLMQPGDYRELHW